MLRRGWPALLACVGALVAGCGGVANSSGRRTSPSACPSCPARLAQVRADTYAAVASRIYHQEVFGADDRAAFAQVAAIAGLQRGLAAGRPALIDNAVLAQPVRHAVRVRIVRGTQVIADVGAPFVLAGVPRPMLAADGRDLGVMEVSVQAVVSYVKLLQRLTGSQVVVRGSAGHAESSLPAALTATLPSSGPVRVGERSFTVSMLRRPGFGGEQLSIWVLTPTR